MISVYLLLDLRNPYPELAYVANIASALGHIFVGFLAVFGRHNIRPPHFASKVSYSASPQTFAECSRSASCRCTASALLFGSKPCGFSSWILNTLPLGAHQSGK